MNLKNSEDDMFIRARVLTKHLNPIEMSSNGKQTFTQIYNPFTGHNEWQPQDQHYDYIQEVARSGYADMLMDHERNQLYYHALKKTLNHLSKHNIDRQIHVLDIGAGTGLLSMMASSLSTESKPVKVTAVECFRPMAECAANVLERNGFNDEKIKLVRNRSDTFNFQEDDRADLLVSELFDTELIGEGALPVFRHAANNLLKKGALTVPHKARIWIQVVESELICNWNQFSSIELKKISRLNVPEKCFQCPGSNFLHDIQLSQLKPDKHFKIVTKPQIAFEFDFGSVDSLKSFDKKELIYEIIENCNSRSLSLFMWWDLCMDFDNEFNLTCAPSWIQEKSSNEIPWRDHWLQAIFYTHFEPRNLKKGDNLNLFAFHDDYSLWFNEMNSELSSPPPCSCGIHLQLSRPRLGLLNDSERIRKFHRVLSKYLTIRNNPPKNILFVGDQSLLPLMVAKDFGMKIYVLTKDSKSIELFYSKFGDANDCNENIILLTDISKVDDSLKFDLVLAEPYFNLVDLPWDLLHFEYLLNQLTNQHLEENSIIIPKSVTLKMIPVLLDNLWKIRAKIKKILGFDLTDFDNLIQGAINLSDSSIESQPLWEYPCKSLNDKPFTIFEWDLNSANCQTTEFRNVIILDKNIAIEKVAAVFWIEFDLDAETKISTGPISKLEKNEYIEWDLNWKQGVSFIGANLQQYDSGITNITSIPFSVNYDIKIGKLRFSIDSVIKSNQCINLTV